MLFHQPTVGMYLEQNSPYYLENLDKNTTILQLNYDTVSLKQVILYIFHLKKAQALRAHMHCIPGKHLTETITWPEWIRVEVRTKQC